MRLRTKAKCAAHLVLATEVRLRRVSPSTLLLHTRLVEKCPKPEHTMTAEDVTELPRRIQINDKRTSSVERG